MEYFECQPPSGSGACSDDACPCGADGASIARGEGYLYVPREVVDFRRDARSVDAAMKKIDRLFPDQYIVGGAGVFAPILMCELGAKKRRLDLQVAAADAKHWWQTGQAPLRPTPIEGQAAEPEEPGPGSGPTTGGGCALLIAAVSIAALLLVAFLV